MRNALVVGLAGGLAEGLVIGLLYVLTAGLAFGLAAGVRVGMGVGLLVGMVGGLMGVTLGGGDACLRHLVLRRYLVRSGSIPRHYVDFLDYASERILLRKVGGGYVFIHRMLLEHFAARYVEPRDDGAPASKPRQTRNEMGE